MRRIKLIGIVIILALLCVPVVPAQMCGPSGIVGTWSWSSGEEKVFNSDGTYIVHPSAGSSEIRTSGTWQLKDPTKQVYICNQENGYIDTLTLSSNCNNLDGYNQNNDHVSATRTEGAPTTQLSPFLNLKFRGTPTLIQSRFGSKGNFEMVAPLATGGLAHFWRDNDAGMAWKGPTIFGGTDLYDAVTMIQSNYGSPGDLEVVARSGDQLVFFWRDSGPSFKWYGPYFLR